MDNANSEPQGRQANYTLFILLLAYILSFIDRNVLAVLVGPIRTAFSLSDTQFGLLHGLAFTIFYAFLGIPIARLADARNRRNLVTVGIAFWSLMCCACGLTKNYLGLFAARMGVGVGEAALSPPAYSMLSDLFPARRLPLAMAIYSMGIPIGSGMAYMVGGWVYGYFASADPVIFPVFGEMAPWQLTFLAVGAPGFLVALLMLPIREPVRKGKLRSTTRDQAPQLSLRQVAAYIISRWKVYGAIFSSISAMAAMGYATMSWYPESLIRRFDIDRSVVGALFGQIFIVAGVAGSLFGGWLATHLQKRGYQDANLRVLAIIAAVWLIPGVLAAFMPTLTLALWMAVPILFFLSSTTGVAVAGLQMVTPNEIRAQVSAVLVLAINVMGLGFGPVIVGLFTDYIFRNEAQLHYSLLLLTLIGCPAAALCAATGLKHYRASLQELAKLG